VITREMVLERLAKLKEERDQLIANLNAYNGAIEDCEYWLSVLDKKVKADDVELQQRPDN